MIDNGNHRGLRVDLNIQIRWRKRFTPRIERLIFKRRADQHSTDTKLIFSILRVDGIKVFLPGIDRNDIQIVLCSLCLAVFPWHKQSI